MKNEKMSGIVNQGIIYDARKFTGYKKHRLRKLLKIISNTQLKFLDVGCGEGQFYDLIKYSRPGIEYFGMDISSV